jgi:integrase
MASIRPKGKGFEARLSVNGKPLSKTHSTREDAQRWAAGVKFGFITPECSTSAHWLTFQEACERYRNEVIPMHKGVAQEHYRIKQLVTLPFANKKLSNITPNELKTYRDGLVVRGLSGSTIRLNLALVSAIFNHARREWGVDAENPVQAIKKPKPSKPRSRRLAGDEEVRLMSALRQCKNPVVKQIVRFLIETGMRRGEALSLRWEDLNLQTRVVTLRDTKSGHARWVPVTEAAAKALPPSTATEARVFPISESTLTQAWGHAMRRAGIKDLRIHDLRHEALSRWAHRLGGDVFKLAMISGHRTLQMAQRYVHPIRAEMLALEALSEPRYGESMPTG